MLIGVIFILVPIKDCQSSVADVGSRNQQFIAETSDSVLHEQFKRKFKTRNLSQAVDEIVTRLLIEEQQCRSEEQCIDGENEDTDKPDNVVPSTPSRPETDGGEENAEDQGNSQSGGGDNPESMTEETSNGKLFYIESLFNHKVLEIPPDIDQVEGAKIQMWDRRGKNDLHQLWYLDSDKYIRSALERNMEFTDSSREKKSLDRRNFLLRHYNGLNSNEVRVGDLKGLEMHPVKSHYKGGRWRWRSEMLLNEAGFALTIRDASRENGAKLIQHDTEPEDHKKWRPSYATI